MTTRPVRTALALAGLALLIVGRSGAAPSPPSTEVILPDTERTVTEVVELVRNAARGVRDAAPARDVAIVFTAEVPDADGEPLLVGLQRESTLWVRVDGVAMPTRTLIHELAHVFAPGAGHGEVFRTIYLAGIVDVYGDSMASREERRLAWVYDRCYVDDSCPAIRR